MKITRSIVLLAVVALAGTWLWTMLFPSPQKVIRARLNAVAREASFETDGSRLTEAMAAEALAEFFSTNAEIDLTFPGNFQWDLTGRDEIKQAVAETRARVSELRVDFPDLNVTVAPDKNSATADLTIRAEVDEDKDSMAEEMKFTLQKIDGQWLITRIETIQVLT